MTLPTRWNPFGQISRMDPFADFEDLLRTFGGRSLAREYERTMDMRLDVNYTRTVAGHSPADSLFALIHNA